MDQACGWWVSKKFSQTIWYLRKVKQYSTNSVFSGHEEVLTLTGDIGKDEVNEGVRKLLSGKALGEDEICLKGPETSVCFGAVLADMCLQQLGQCLWTDRPGRWFLY